MEITICIKINKEHFDFQLYEKGYIEKLKIIDMRQIRGNAVKYASLPRTVEFNNLRLFLRANVGLRVLR